MKLENVNYDVFSSRKAFLSRVEAAVHAETDLSLESPAFRAAVFERKGNV